MVAGDAPINVLTASTIKNKKGATFRVASTSTETLKILAAYPLDDLHSILDDLFSEFLILIPIALVVSVGGGYFLANISLRPVDAVTKTAQEITAHNLDRRLHESGVNDEIGRLSSTFNDMIARLNSSFQQVKQFTIDASHELRTPLTIMRGEVELALRSPKSTEQYKAVLVSALEEIVRLTSIIDGLMLLSKADLGMQEVAFGKVELSRMVEELYEDAEILASKKHIVVALQRNDQIELLGDEVRLSQLLLNLVDNAVKYTPENGRIFISSERQNGNARICVRDTGMGIPVDEQARIFNRFYRVDKARTRDLGGIGLGLSIVKWVTDLHRGSIEVQSEEGKGSEFTVILPINGAAHG
jgi:heavy metal sensor kinase